MPHLSLLDTGDIDIAIMSLNPMRERQTPPVTMKITI